LRYKDWLAAILPWGGWTMKVGDKAPDFSLSDENGATVSLQGLRGKHVVLYFFPKANTPG
jgi:peroxiredoxin Q/BCP